LHRHADATDAFLKRISIKTTTLSVPVLAAQCSQQAHAHHPTCKELPTQAIYIKFQAGIALPAACISSMNCVGDSISDTQYNTWRSINNGGITIVLSGGAQSFWMQKQLLQPPGAPAHA
jgi:hypothetical protein